MEQNSSGPGGFDRSGLQNVQSWQRSRSDRMVAGVCGGIGRALNIDPVLVRVVMAVLIISGPGIIFYIAAWVLMPDEGKGPLGGAGSARRPGPPGHPWLWPIVIGACVFAGHRLMSSFDFGRVVPGPLIVLAVIWIVARHRRKLRRGGQQQDWAANRGWSGPQDHRPRRSARSTGSTGSVAAGSAGSGRSAWSSRQPGQWKPRLQAAAPMDQPTASASILDILGEPREANYEAVPRVHVHRPAGRRGRRDRGAASARPPSWPRSPRRPRTRARTRSRNGFLTLLSDGERLTGAYALGPEAGEWLQQATLAIRARVPLDVLLDTIQPFPTFSEIYLPSR